MSHLSFAGRHNVPCRMADGNPHAGAIDSRIMNVPRERLQRMAAAITEALPRAIVRIV
jgi:hypothetical protein